MREFRHDPIQKRWVIISSGRAERPSELATQPSYTLNELGGSNGACPFCTGNESATPPELLRLPQAVAADTDWTVRVVPNKFPALRIEGELDRRGHGQYDRLNGIGAHEVIIETPQHGLELADLDDAHIAQVLRAYRERLSDLMRDPRFRYVIIFKNHGAEAGASLSHSHSQIIATPVTPRTVSMELSSARAHYQLKERCLFCDLMHQELADGERLVLVDDRHVTFCPYASRFPYEMTLMPRVHSHDYAALSDDALDALASHLGEVLRRMNRHLGRPAYNFMLHTAPNTRSSSARANYWATLRHDWHWHLEILPRLTSVAGFEWGTGFYINPTPPEQAAAALRGATEA